MQIKVTLRFHLTQLEWKSRIQTTNSGKDAGKRDPHSLLVGMQISVATMEVSIEVYQKAKK
jgi:hypothetical protein